ncbi:hypothetical protein AMAG_08143 [Allomyces macrogynus ATCC 38327]|uniref:Uncharacterized protein n=1 Tax=Allomyces macrogynus (strain ATCC 38327) TaxID=578462 RepID=A0A0L0SKF1_ALLM3|nr:hypothetical protein AMAG_08143 [Allomyces macrogynus ATCC 38327]|eukprot:KNE62972.1 hypothetical protein AMAG_08143 [Allomyces macrogynus ATCC 38327]
MSSGPPPPGYPGTAHSDPRRPNAAVPTYPTPQQPFSLPMPVSGVPFMQQQAAYPLLPPPAPSAGHVAAAAAIVSAAGGYSVAAWIRVAREYAAGRKHGVVLDEQQDSRLCRRAIVVASRQVPVAVQVSISVPGTSSLNPVAKPWSQLVAQSQPKSKLEQEP